MISDMHAIASLFPDGTDTSLDAFEKALDAKLSALDAVGKDKVECLKIQDYKTKLASMRTKGVQHVTNKANKFTVSFSRDGEEPVAAGASVKHARVVRFYYHQGQKLSVLTDVEGVTAAFAGVSMATVESVELRQQPSGEVFADAKVRFGFFSFSMPRVTLRQDGTLKL